MSVQVHGGAAVPRLQKRVFLATGTVKTGEAVCYNWDVTDVSAENESVLSASAAMWCDARRLMVERPSTSNHMHFAGVVDSASNGITGPNWIVINVPGSVCKVYTKSTVSAGFSGNRSTGQVVTFCVGLNTVGVENTTYNGKFVQGGLPGMGSALVLAEGAASVPSDTYLKMAELLTGGQSGGVQMMALVSTAYSTATAIMHGVIDLALADSAGVTAGTISVADGKFVDQRFVVKGPVTDNSVAVAVNFTTLFTPFISGEYLSAAPLVSANQATLTAATKFIDAVWNGTAWVIRSNAKTT